MRRQSPIISALNAVGFDSVFKRVALIIVTVLLFGFLGPLFF